MKETSSLAHWQGREVRGKEIRSAVLARTDFVFQLDPHSSPDKNWTDISFLNILEDFFCWEQLYSYLNVKHNPNRYLLRIYIQLPHGTIKHDWYCLPHSPPTFPAMQCICELRAAKSYGEEERANVAFPQPHCHLSPLDGQYDTVFDPCGQEDQSKGKSQRLAIPPWHITLEGNQVSWRITVSFCFLNAAATPTM